MANEGSTKPTYSELEAENLRVRGLLQRAKDAIYDQICPVPKTELTKDLQLRSVWNELAAETNFRDSPDPVPQGAESADIGKLDTADKSGVEMGKVNSADEGSDEEYARYEQYLYGWKAHEAKHKMMTFSGWVREERKLGSAETGGENTAANPQLVIACLEEAIELFELDDEVNTPGTDSWLWKVKSEQALIAYADAEASPTFRQSPSPTDSGAESVEPEKLNNAQGENMVNEVCAYCGKEVFHNGFNYEHVGGGAFCRDNNGKPRMVEPAKRGAQPEALALYAPEEPVKEVPMALAESSLSSPPHTHETDKVNNCWECIGERLRETGNITTYRSPELLPTQLDPIAKHPLTPGPQSTQLDTHSEKK